MTGGVATLLEKKHIIQRYFVVFYTVDIFITLKFNNVNLISPCGIILFLTEDSHNDVLQC